MNTASKAVMAVAIVFLLTACTVSIAHESDAGVVSITLNPSEDRSTDVIGNYLKNGGFGVDSEIEITLNSGIYYYSINSWDAYTVKSLTIKAATDADVTIVPNDESNDLVLTCGLQTSGTTLIVQNIKFSSQENSSGRVLLWATWDSVFEGCTFENMTLTRMTGGTNDKSLGGTMTVMDCTFGGNYLTATKIFGITVIAGNVVFSNNKVTGYERGLNIDLNSQSEKHIVTVSGNDFTDLGLEQPDKPGAIQLGGDMGGADVVVSGNTITRSSDRDQPMYGVSIHDGATYDNYTSVTIFDNTFNNCTADVFYAGDTAQGETPNYSLPVTTILNISNDAQNQSRDIVVGNEDNAEVPVGETALDQRVADWYDLDATEYRIDSEADLLDLAILVNSGVDFRDKTIYLDNDIELKSGDWTPIGHGSRSETAYTDDSTPFRGTFNGQGKTISNLSIITTTGVEDPIGLFGIIDGGTVKNLTLEDVSIVVSDSEMAGSVAGMVCGGGTVLACTVTSGSSVSVGDSAGGIVGKVFSNGKISGCINYASVTTASGNTGGIVGASYYKSTGNGLVIEKCTNNGAVTSSGGYTGGIVGLSSANVYNCINNGAVTADGSSVGGIVGTQKNAGIISNCTNNGVVVNGTDIQNLKNYGTGGIVGWTNYLGDGNFEESDLTQIVVERCHNNASVKTNGTGAGGIIGMAYHGVTVEDCDSGINDDCPELTIIGGNMIGGIIGGVQYDSDAKHVNGGCQTRIIGNKCGGTVSNLGSADNMAKLAGHVLATSSDDTCSPVHGSFTTILNNTTSNMAGAEVDITGGGDTVAYIEFEGEKYGYPSLTAAIEGSEDGSIIVLIRNVTESVTITSGNTIVLDLNGFRIQSAEGSSTHVIDVLDGGILTIQDSSENGTGTVDCLVNGKACLNIQSGGQATVTGGNFIRSNIVAVTEDADGANTWYVVNNYGTLSINGGTFVLGYEDTDSASGYYLGNVSSVIRNGLAPDAENPSNPSYQGIMSITGGTFWGAANILKNENGTMTVSNAVLNMDNRDIGWYGGNNAVQNYGTISVSDSTINIHGSGAGVGKYKDYNRYGFTDSGVSASVVDTTMNVDGTGTIAFAMLGSDHTGDFLLNGVTLEMTGGGNYAFYVDGETEYEMRVVSGIYDGSARSGTSGLVIEGGTFSESDSIGQFLAPGKMIGDDGSVTDVPDYISNVSVPSQILDGVEATLSVTDNADPDHSELTYTWYADGEPMGEGTSITFTPQIGIDYTLVITGTYYGDDSFKQEINVTLNIVDSVSITFCDVDESGHSVQIRVPAGEPINDVSGFPTAVKENYEFQQWTVHDEVAGIDVPLKGYAPSQDISAVPEFKMVKPDVTYSVSGDLFHDGYVTVTVHATHVLDSDGTFVYQYLMGNADTNDYTAG